MNLEKLINEYPKNYCAMLELAYGKDMMSEGGNEGIDHMFSGIYLNQKKCLDIGFGLGGVSHYLARTYNASVIGLEINPWMVMEANKKIPISLKHLLHFVTYKNFPTIPFSKNEFDIVYSKGVFVHLQNKQEIFNEMYRVLKSGGDLVIDDWLSPTDHVWSERVKKIMEMEDLTLIPTSEESYFALIKQVGFNHITLKNISQYYSQYNFQIVKRLKNKKIAAKFQKKFGEKVWYDSIEGYQMIAEAMQQNEIIVMNIRAIK